MIQAFSVRDASGTGTPSKITVNEGRVLIDIIDSGASCDIIDQILWEKLKAEHIKCESMKGKPNLYAYGSKEPLAVIGTFTAQVILDQTILDNVEFIVIEGRGNPYLAGQLHWH